MDFLTVLKYVLAIIETGALIGALVMSAKGFHEHKDKNSRKSMITKAAFYFLVYIVLSMVRLMYFPA